MMAPAGGGRPAALAQRGSDMTEPGDHTLSPRELEERFDLLVADAREYAVLIVDPGGKLLCWNPGAERLFGYRTDEVMGQHFSRLFAPEDVRSGQPEHELKVALADGHAEAVRWQLRKDGTRFWC